MPRAANKRTRFIAIDGEAIDDQYVMLCTSKRDSLEYRELTNLSTHDCFEFLLKLRRDNPNSKFVAFGLNYDVNMMLHNLHRPALEKLWAKGDTWVTLDGVSYRLQWIPRKSFQIYQPDTKTRVRIYDVFGFFQSSFVRALEDWKIEDVKGTIARMKGERAKFSRDQVNEIREYCFDECALLVQLMEDLEDAMIQAGIKLRSWMGAGSVAQAILQKEGVKKKRVSDGVFPSLINSAIHHAYFGGRIEVFQQGIFENVTNYDIRSAYPHQALFLPSLQWQPKQWEHTTEFRNEPGLHALWRVEWDVNELENPIMPFPLRHKEMIFYPANGKGWYHHVEVRAAMALYPNHIRVTNGFIFHPCDSERPFSFVRDYYRERLEAKAKGEAREKSYKLGLNSLYGKLAQGQAYKGEPPYRSLFWAGRITSGTRARLLDVAALDPASVVSMATDGIVFRDDPGIAESTELGGFERTELAHLFVAQPGIYLARDYDGKEARKSRGFFTREIDYVDLEQGWLRFGPEYVQESVCECGRVSTAHPTEDCESVKPRRRFIGLGSALMRRDFTVWNTWLESERRLSLHSARKTYAAGEPERLVAVKHLIAPRFPDTLESEPYVPKTATLEQAREEMYDLISAAEQPLESEDMQ